MLKDQAESETLQASLDTLLSKINKLEKAIQDEQKEKQGLNDHIKVLEAELGRKSDMAPDASHFTLALKKYMRKDDLLCKSCFHITQKTAAEVHRIQGELEEEEERHQATKDKHKEALVRHRIERDDLKAAVKVS